MKKALSCQLLLFAVVGIAIGCKSGVESQLPAPDLETGKIVIEDEPFRVDSATLVRVLLPKSVSNGHTYLWRIDDSVFSTVQIVDSIFLTVHEPGLHHISVEVFDAVSASTTHLQRAVLVSMAPVSAAKLASLHTVLLKFTGALIGKNYYAYNDSIADYTIDTTGLQIQCPILMTDGGLYYASTSAGSGYSSNHTYGSGNSNQSIQFKLDDHGRILSQGTAGYSDSKSDHGYSEQTEESLESVTTNEVPLVGFRKDTLVYRLSGKALKETLFTIFTTTTQSRYSSYNLSDYHRYVRDSVDWNNAAHPPQLSILIF